MCEDCGCSDLYDDEKEEHAHNHDHTHDHEHPHNHDHVHTHDHAHEHSHPHAHDHDHAHDHPHTHDHTHQHENGGTYSHSHNHDDAQHTHKHDKVRRRTVNVEKDLLARNNEIAEQNRKWLHDRGIITVNLISSPGSGKTTLLEKTLEEVGERIPCAVIVGDQQTDNDAKRIEKVCKNVVQIETHSTCHLNAEQVSGVLSEVIDENTKLLFIENVGNLVCPSAFDLGEDFKIALLSTPEGEDKAVKYPVLFSNAGIVLLTKTDLTPHLEFDIKLCRQYVRQIQPGVFIFEVSAKTGEGMSEWFDYLAKLVD